MGRKIDLTLVKYSKLLSIYEGSKFDIVSVTIWVRLWADIVGRGVGGGGGWRLLDF